MSFTPKRILVPTDESDNAKLALAEAVSIAKLTDAEVYLLEVVAPLYSAPQYPVEDLAGQVTEHAKAYTQRLAEKTIAETGFTKIKSLVSSGIPKPTIAKTIPEKYEIDLIVIGATGTNAFERALLGSTTGYVVRNATVNVMVVKDPEA
ncbi:universal stress protein [Furfurilactobacillus sp. WILCCON 0119]|uniref:universal stress protein n=1 Tax=Furfurilactobacillus entadae TaxID=2922307 RepID=UPI0035F0947E